MRLGSNEANGTCPRHAGFRCASRLRVVVPRFHRVRGFSLLEVIAAILLLAIAFTALMQVAGGSMALSGHAAEASKAALWAQSKLDGMTVIEPLREGSSEGQFDAQYRWRLKVSPWVSESAVADVGSTPMQLYRVDLDVLWGNGRRERSAHFTTLRVK
ncbi:prepilin-type N-terminal cleavage/methylation domain-containing protein [Dyella silvatica]|uniref:prepilin-type N-terminal cleavage/methylation domain-containing protein n=1 Tax=Dyella silvatica TaxID=2992128 RepID=UPI00224E3A1F|nr:prepilin-type N-terminal cleavage/methylation domain-containing protein [Dyella silvatica]